MNEEMIKKVVAEVISGYLEDQSSYVSEGLEIPIGTSARHVHLSETDVERLFGKGYVLTKKRDISQPGQFLCEERVTIIGPKNVFQNVAVLGPIRKNTQVEISVSDARILGVDPPVAMSGELDDAGDIMIASPQACIKAEKSLIVAKNHVHFSAQEARQAGVSDGDLVDVVMQTERSLTFRNVPVRAGDKHKLEMHIDFDEANACLYKKGDKAILIKQTGIRPVNPQACEIQEKSAKDFEKAGPVSMEMKLETKFVTEKQMQEAVLKGCHMISVGKKAIISPLAMDLARQNNMQICYL